MIGCLCVAVLHWYSARRKSWVQRFFQHLLAFLLQVSCSPGRPVLHYFYHHYQWPLYLHVLYLFCVVAFWPTTTSRCLPMNNVEEAHWSSRAPPCGCEVDCSWLETLKCSRRFGKHIFPLECRCSVLFHGRTHLEVPWWLNA